MELTRPQVDKQCGAGLGETCAFVSAVSNKSQAMVIAFRGTTTRRQLLGQGLSAILGEMVAREWLPSGAEVLIRTHFLLEKKL